VTGAQPARGPLLNHERSLLLLSLLAVLPGLALALLLVWQADLAAQTRWIASLVAVALWWAAGVGLRDRAVSPLRALSNLLAGLRDGDTSFKVRAGRGDDALGLALFEANALRDALAEERLGAGAGRGFHREVTAALDAPTFAFDPEGRLCFVNPAGERLLMQSRPDLLGRDARSLGLAECVDAGRADVRELAFPGGAGRFAVRARPFGRDGRTYQLVVLTDVDRTLRQEERELWRRLLLRLGEELGDGLAPIRSLSTGLQDLLERGPASECEGEIREGLAVIASRSAALERLVAGHARLAGLPRPELRPVAVRELVSLVRSLETRLPVEVEEGPEVAVQADPVQLEELLSHLVRNAVDAARETHGGVRVGWRVAESHLELWVDDDGPGLADPARLFVPFATTKPGGTGLGLVLSRQIAEAHGGMLTLENRPAGGCRACLRLPL